MVRVVHSQVIKMIAALCIGESVINKEESGGLENCLGLEID